MTDSDCLAEVARHDLTARQLSRMAGRSPSIDRQIARHPSASPALLKRLAKGSDRNTLANVAGNPNAPRDTLLRLAAAYTDEFFLNPAFDLLLMEEPNLLHEKLRPAVLKKILKRSDCPPSFISWAIQHGTSGQQLAVAARPAVTVETLQALARSPHAKAAELAMIKLMGLGGQAALAETGQPSMSNESESHD